MYVSFSILRTSKLFIFLIQETISSNLMSKMYFVFPQISSMLSSVMFGFKDFKGKEYDYFISSQNRKIWKYANTTPVNQNVTEVNSHFLFLCKGPFCEKTFVFESHPSSQKLILWDGSRLVLQSQSVIIWRERLKNRFLQTGPLKKNHYGILHWKKKTGWKVRYYDPYKWFSLWVYYIKKGFFLIELEL